MITTNIFLYLSSRATTSQGTQTETATTPKRLNITIKVTEPDNLKIGEGSSVKTKDIIADRERERTRLTAQQKQLSLFSHFSFISFQAITVH